MKRNNYLCQPCKRANRFTEAREIDHVVELHEGGTDDESNLQAICIPCHKAKTHGIQEGQNPKVERKPPRLKMLSQTRVSML